MAIKLKTEEGFEFSFDTVDELMEFTKRMNEEEASKELTSTPEEDTSVAEVEIPENEPKFEVGDMVKVVENKSGGHEVGTIGEISGVRHILIQNRWSYEVTPNSGYLKNYEQHHKETDLELLELSDNELEVGDKVRVVSAEDGTDTPYHGHEVGSIGKVVSKLNQGGTEVEVDGEIQYLLYHHYVKIEPLGKDANGEDLYEGDYITGTEGNEHAYTDDTVIMEIVGAGESPLFTDANIKVMIVGDWSKYNVNSSDFVKLSNNLDEAEEKFNEEKGEGEDELLPVGTKVRLLKQSSSGYLNPGDVGSIMETDEGCFMGLVYSVRVHRGEGGYDWVSKEDIEVVDEEQEFKVGDRVRVVGNVYGHFMDLGEVYEIKSVDSEEPKYNLSHSRINYWAGTCDIEHVQSSTKFRSGDVVKVTEAFEDTTGDRVTSGAVYNYDEILEFGETFVGTVFLGDNIDKLELVCRAQDRLDK